MFTFAVAGTVALLVVAAILAAAVPALARGGLELSELQMEFILWSVFSICVLVIALR